MLYDNGRQGLYWENGDNDAGDFLVGTNSGISTGDGPCYERGGSFISNCWGAYDGHGNMCSRNYVTKFKAYSPAQTGCWHVMVR